MLVMVVLVAAVFAAVRARRALTAATACDSARAGLVAGNDALREKIRQAEKARSEIRPNSAPGKMNETQGMIEKRRAESVARAHEQAKAFNKKLEEDHAFALKIYAAKRARMDVEYGPFLHSLHLSSVQRDAVADALFGREMRLYWLERRLFAGELSWNDMGARNEVKGRAQSDLRDEMMAIAGENVVSAFERYERAQPAWKHVNGFATEMVFADMPVSLEQAAQLASAIAESSESYQKGGIVKMAEVDWESVDARARAFLNDAQIDFLRKAGMVKGDFYTDTRPGIEFQQAISKLGK